MRYTRSEPGHNNGTCYFFFIFHMQILFTSRVLVPLTVRISRPPHMRPCILHPRSVPYTCHTTAGRRTCQTIWQHHILYNVSLVGVNTWCQQSPSSPPRPRRSERQHRQGTGAGSRIHSTCYMPQHAAYTLRNISASVRNCGKRFPPRHTRIRAGGILVAGTPDIVPVRIHMTQPKVPAQHRAPLSAQPTKGRKHSRDQET